MAYLYFNGVLMAYKLYSVLITGLLMAYYLLIICFFIVYYLLITII